MKDRCIFVILFFCFYSCSPIKSSPEDKKHKMELTLHEIKIDIDELKHDLDCFKTNICLVDHKIKNQEKKEKEDIDILFLKFNNLEKKCEELTDLLKKLSFKTEGFIEKLKKKDKIVYIVKEGDSLEKIAEFYNMEVSEIKKINDIKGDLITVGQELKIP